MSRGIDHIGVTVPDLDAATRFFVEAFDAAVLYDTLRRDDGPDTGRGLGAPAEVAVRMLALPGGPGIELFAFRTPRRDPGDLGRQHIAFYVDDIEAAAARVSRAGGIPLGDPRPGGNRFWYARTPWGGTLELLTHADPRPREQATDRRRP
ncbi:Glyoxalase-like domain protein [Actinomadura rubteroloni]|uniref:Glyoxalase-like domain protein n=1 Tax=Actinomadura rubteroloni TaxID=1926885 RepID=A0A2P4URH8_9ACTN|nr:VOC family protein [Actinomadura rubteroloni]POM27650.1 Glyoxalase-like domain protein [Actinomadura rubteroloni]